MPHGSSHAEPRNIAGLIALVGPDQAAALSAPSATSIEAIDAFGQRIARMSDAQLRAEFNASDGLVSDLRELQATCGF